MFIVYAKLNQKIVYFVQRIFAGKQDLNIYKNELLVGALCNIMELNAKSKSTRLSFAL